MAEEIRLHNVMEKAQNIPLEYDAPRAHTEQNWNGQIIVNEDYMKPASRPRENWNDQGSNIVNEDYMKPTSYPKENWNDQGNKIDILNESYMKPAASEERLEKIPIEINALPRSPPVKDVSDKEKVKPSFFPQIRAPVQTAFHVLECGRIFLICERLIALLQKDKYYFLLYFAFISFC